MRTAKDGSVGWQSYLRRATSTYSLGRVFFLVGTGKRPKLPAEERGTSAPPGPPSYPLIAQAVSRRGGKTTPRQRTSASPDAVTPVVDRTRL